MHQATTQEGSIKKSLLISKLYFKLLLKKWKEVYIMPKKNTHRLRADFNHASNFDLHPDAKKALDEAADALPNYPKYMIVSFFIMRGRKEIDKLEISGTDDLEERLDLLT